MGEVVKLNYERIYIQYNDLVFDGFGMLDEYDASDVPFKVTTHPRSFTHGSYAPFKSKTVLADEGSVSMTVWLKHKKLPCEQRPFYRDFVIEQLSHHGRLWAVQNNTLVWAYATVSSYSEMVEHYNGKVGIDVDFLLYEGIWHKADKQKTFLHPYDICSFMDCYDYENYQPCLQEEIFDCPGVEIDPQSDSGYIVTFIKEDYRDGFESLVTAIEPKQLCSPWEGSDTNNTAYNFRAIYDNGDIDVGNREIGNIVGGTLVWNQLVRDHGDDKTLTGDIVSFDDAEEYSSLKSLTIPLTPIQDLNGYDSPWVGGAGKNKLVYPYYQNSVTVNGVTATANSDGTVTVNGTCTETGSYMWLFRSSVTSLMSTLNEGESYTYSLEGAVSGLNGQIICYGSPSVVFNVIGGNTDKSVTFTVPDMSNYRGFAVVLAFTNGSTFNNVTVKPMIRLASETDATYAPYSNICPISGWDGVNTTVAGKNLVPMTATSRTSSGIMYAVNADGSITINGTATATSWLRGATSEAERQFLRAGTYHLSGTPSGRLFTVYIIGAYLDGTNLTQSNVTGGVYDTGSGLTFTLLMDATVTYQIQVNSGTTVNNITVHPQIELGTTATTYEPYNGTTYPVNLSDTAGTVYGGTLDVVSGELTVERKTEIYDGSESWYAETIAALGVRSFYRARQADAKETIHSGDIITNLCNVNVGSWVDGTMRPTSGYYNFLLGTALGITTATEWSAYLANNPLQICYKLATPQTYQLTPTQIMTLIGDNNVWSDAGETTLTYTSKYADYTLDNHKYLMRKNGADSIVTGGTQTLEARKDNLFDLTLMFGTTVASQNGVILFRSLFPAPYYQYNAGEMLSVNASAHITTGINQWDEEWENGNFNLETLRWTSGDRVISKNPIRVLPNTRYQAYYPTAMLWVFYDANGEYISHESVTGTAYCDTPSNAYAMKFSMFPNYGSVYNNDICISLYNSYNRYTYEPYEENIYPLDSSLTLRGVPILTDWVGKIAYDGDTYRFDGTVKRNFAVIDLGTKTWRKDGGHFYTTFADMAQPQNPTAMRRGVMLKYPASSTDSVTNLDNKSWLMAYTSANAELHLKDTDYSTADALKAALDGVLFLYPLRNPTTETADPYTLKHIINEYGTEEYVDHAYEMGERDVAIPVGHLSHYALICPVYGHNGVDVHVTGINVWDEKWEQGYFRTTDGRPLSSTAQIRSKNFIPAAPGEEYYLSCPSGGVILFYDKNKGYLEWTAGGSFTVPSDAYYMKFYTYNTYGGAYNDDISINYPATETEYHPYDGMVYPVTWQNEVGTVYKATVDIAQGKIISYMVGVDMSTLNIQPYRNRTFIVTLPDKNETVEGVIDYASDIFEAKEPISDIAEATNGLFALTSYPNALIIKDDNYDTTYLEGREEFYELIKGQYLYYTLAEPIEEEFTPYNLPTMDGLNNILIPEASLSYESTGVHDPGESCVYEREPYGRGHRHCCDCDCDNVTKDMALCYHLDDLQDVYKYCSNAGFRVIYDCDAAERFFNLLGQKICVTNCHNGVIAGKIYSETDLPTDGITITLVGKMHNPSIEINGNLNWIAGDYDGRLRIESSGDVYYENDCCSDPLEPDIWQKPSDMDYGWKILPRYNRIIVNLGACCGKACAYFDIDNITI